MVDIVPVTQAARQNTLATVVTGLQAKTAKVFDSFVFTYLALIVAAAGC